VCPWSLDDTKGQHLRFLWEGSALKGLSAYDLVDDTVYTRNRLMRTVGEVKMSGDRVLQSMYCVEGVWEICSDALTLGEWQKSLIMLPWEHNMNANAAVSDNRRTDSTRIHSRR